LNFSIFNFIKMSSSVHNLISHHFKTGEPEPSPVAKNAYRLYNMRYCPYAHRTVLYLARKNIPVEIINIYLKNKPEWYCKINPMGQVPAFEEQGGKVVTESTVIAQYLDDIFPECTVLPKDPYKKAQQKILAERLSPIVPTFYAAARNSNDPKAIEENKQKMIKAFENAEDSLKADFFGGEKASYADYMIWPFIERVHYLTQLQADNVPFGANDFPGNEKFPKLTSWFKRMMELPEVKIAHAPTDKIGAYWQSYRDGNPNHDVEL